MLGIRCVHCVELVHTPEYVHKEDIFIARWRRLYEVLGPCDTLLKMCPHISRYFETENTLCPIGR